MTRYVFSALCALFLLLPIPSSAQGQEGAQLWQASVQAGFPKLLNRYRSRSGLRPLRRSEALEGVARAHAIYMQKKSDLNHRGAGGSRLPHRLRARGIKACLGGENLGRGQISSTQVFGDWVASPRHNRILLMQGVTHYGLARSGEYWALVVARPC